MSEEPYLDIVSMGLRSTTLSDRLAIEVTAIVAPLCTALLENDLFLRLEALVLLEGILVLL
jgi:hypothetical protein